MQYQTFPPPPDLAHIVEHFWAVENPTPLDRHREILIPNGRLTVLLCLGAPSLRIADTGTSLPNANNIAGPLTGPVVLEQSGLSSYAAAQLHPWGMVSLEVGHHVDSAVALETIVDKAAVSEAVAACRECPFGPDRTKPVAAIVRHLAGTRTPRRLDAIREAVGLVDRKRGLIDIEHITGTLDVSYDSLYRLFKGMTGLSPKQYISIVRFYHFAGDLLGDVPESLALLANLQGYYDQPHATREFRRYTGISQTRFRHRLNGIARLMHRK